MKFSVFSDLHIFPHVFMGGTYEDLDFMRDRALREGCSFIIHAGDFAHNPARECAYVDYYNAFPLPTYHCLGNHDSDETSLAETLALYNMERGYYFFDADGFRFIICDPNYYKDGEDYIHYDLGNYYAHPDARDYMPPEQLAWLAETVDTSPYPCVLISHESFERADGVQNRDAVRRIIGDANKKRRHSVILCINGHYHRDGLRIWDEVLYFDLNSASYDWAPTEHRFYPEEYNREYTLMNHSIVYNDPIHAVVTLEKKEDSIRIKIDGMESTEFLGVKWADTENRLYDEAGTTNTPRVSSVDMIFR